MNNLDDNDAIKKLDEENVLGSIEQVGLQCQQAWDDVKTMTFPDSYRNVSNIVFAGMGGSALGAYVIRSLYFDSLKLPFEIFNNYHVPPYVNEKTLAIICSYSGTTEESLSFVREALERKAQVTGIAVGKTLADIFQSAKIPAYVFDAKFNPSGQPRLGSGYTIYGQIAILSRLGFIEVTDDDTNAVVSVSKEGNKRYGLSVPAKDNAAKQLALRWYEKIPVIVSSEFLMQIGRVMRNQFHECAKSFAAYHDIPELNHHLMEALTYPKRNKEILSFFFMESDFYSDPIKKRFLVTKDVVSKQGIAYHSFRPASKTKLTQAFECIQFGAYVNYYMSMLYDINPSKIPWVDYFKAELAKT